MSNGSPSVYSSILLPMDLDPSTEGRCKLAVGLADRFASNHQLLADALPEGRVFTTEGGHDWPQWSRLWRKMLDVLPLPAGVRQLYGTAPAAPGPKPALKAAVLQTLAAYKSKPDR